MENAQKSMRLAYALRDNSTVFLRVFWVLYCSVAVVVVAVDLFISLNFLLFNQQLFRWHHSPSFTFLVDLIFCAYWLTSPAHVWSVNRAGNIIPFTVICKNLHTMFNSFKVVWLANIPIFIPQHSSIGPTKWASLAIEPGPGASRLQRLHKREVNKIHFLLAGYLGKIRIHRRTIRQTLFPGFECNEDFVAGCIEKLPANTTSFSI